MLLIHRRVLLLGYLDGFQIWDISQPDHLSELVSLRKGLNEVSALKVSSSCACVVQLTNRFYLHLLAMIRLVRIGRSLRSLRLTVSIYIHSPKAASSRRSRSMAQLLRSSQIPAQWSFQSLSHQAYWCTMHPWNLFTRLMMSLLIHTLGIQSLILDPDS